MASPTSTKVHIVSRAGGTLEPLSSCLPSVDHLKKGRLPYLPMIPNVPVDGLRVRLGQVDAFLRVENIRVSSSYDSPFPKRARARRPCSAATGSWGAWPAPRSCRLAAGRPQGHSRGSSTPDGDSSRSPDMLTWLI